MTVGNQPLAEQEQEPEQMKTFKILCRADEGFCLTVRHDSVVLAPTNPRDEKQHWFKDMRHSGIAKDEEGMPAFSLVNKATGLAIKHSLGLSHPVTLVAYNPEIMYESVLWTESRDVGEGFCRIRMVNNILLNFDAFNGDKYHGGVHDGTIVVLWDWRKGDNQRWKILPWAPSSEGSHQTLITALLEPQRNLLPPALASEFTMRVYCKADQGYSLTHWVKDMRHSTDEEGYPAFALVNRATGEAIKHSLGLSHPVRLVPYNPDYVDDDSVMWTESTDVGQGFRRIRMVNNILLNLDALHGDKYHGGIHDGTAIVLWDWRKGDNQRWKILPW